MLRRSGRLVSKLLLGPCRFPSELWCWPVQGMEQQEWWTTLYVPFGQTRLVEVGLQGFRGDLTDVLADDAGEVVFSSGHLVEYCECCVGLRVDGGQLGVGVESQESMIMDRCPSYQSCCWDKGSAGSGPIDLPTFLALHRIASHRSSSSTHPSRQLTDMKNGTAR